ncbi:hypothetical protein D9M72_388100 [compost metagenome]
MVIDIAEMRDATERQRFLHLVVDLQERRICEKTRHHEPRRNFAECLPGLVKFDVPKFGVRPSLQV